MSRKNLKSLIRSLAHSLTRSRAHRKEIGAFETVSTHSGWTKRWVMEKAKDVDFYGHLLTLPGPEDNFRHNLANKEIKHVKKNSR